MSYSCKIIADSLTPQGNRLVTYKVTYPRIIHAEMCRHRMLSRNTASSRAIPFKKMVEDVEKNPFIPIAWQKNHKGMQGSEYLEINPNVFGPVNGWLEARNKAVELAKYLNELDVTKQLCNRLLEPFVWTTELITGTEWDNFFELRCPSYYDGETVHRSRKDYLIKNDPDRNKTYSEEYFRAVNESQAEIHIQKIAEMMWDSYNESKPKELQAGEWHIPYGDKIGIEDCFKAQPYSNKSDNGFDYYIEVATKIATARCARISYETLGDNPKIDYEADIKLHDRLLKDKHLSPFEHCARAMNNEEYITSINGKIIDVGCEKETYEDGYECFMQFTHNIQGWHNNFRGWISYRSLIDKV